MRKLVVDIENYEELVITDALLKNALFVFADKTDADIFCNAYPSAKTVTVSGIRFFYPSDYNVGTFLAKLGAPITDVCFVTDSLITDLILAYGWKVAGFLPMVNPSRCPDYLLNDINEIPSLLHEERDSNMPAEVTFFPKQSGITKYLWEPIDDSLPEVALFSLGRYFPNKHYRHQVHLLSNAITLNKGKGKALPHAFDKSFASLYDKAIKEVAPHINMILSVPPRAGCEDRFAPIIQDLCGARGIPVLSNLWANDSAVAQKELENVSERRENVQGKISFQGDLRGKEVIIIDDIATTKASLSECAKALIAAGAIKVTAIVLGRNQPSVSYHSGHVPVVTCPFCGNALNLRFNSKTLEPFWGKCTCEFFRGRNYEAGIADIHDEMNKEDYSTKDDFWGIRFE